MVSPFANGFTLTNTAVTHFETQGSLENGFSDDFEYEYVLDCKPTAQRGPIAIALSNLKVQLRNRQTLQLEQEFVAHDSGINELWTSDTSPWNIGTCSNDKTVKFWDLRTTAGGGPCMQFDVRQKCWSVSVGCGDSLAVVGTNHKAHFFDVRNCKKLGEYGESHLDAVTKVRFHPTQLPFVVTASEDGIVCLFDCRIPREEDAIESILNVESAVREIGFFGPQLENLFCLTSTETLDLWNLQQAQRIHHFATIREDLNKRQIATDYLIDCVYDQGHDQLFLLSGDHQGTANVLHIDAQFQPTPVCAPLQRGHKTCVRCVWADPEDGILFTGGEDARLCQWTPSTGSNGITTSVLTPNSDNAATQAMNSCCPLVTSSSSSTTSSSSSSSLATKRRTAHQARKKTQPY